MRRVLLNLPPDIRDAIWQHLLPRGIRPLEEVAFIFARTEKTNDSVVFEYVEWRPVGKKGFLSRSGYHFELADEARAGAIKRAHDLGTSLVEAHSHIVPGFACFSQSDILGFSEFVPHVWWRLRGRPYLALVVSRSGFDGLAWLDSPNIPQYLDGITSDGKIFISSKATPLEKYSHYDEQV